MTTQTMTADERQPPTFDAMPLSDEVRRALSDMDYEEPTPVQTAVWVPAADGKDLVVQARTGTGKTTAFGLPLIDRIVYPSKSHPQALILCPTRELALQVSRELEKLAAHKGITLTAIYGGAPMGKQIDAIASGKAQIIAGTPGRVLDHMRRGTLDPSSIRALVLDEADEMLSMGFEKELTAIIERLPERRQTLLFSATVPPDIERMAKTRLREPEFVILSGDQIGALEINHYVYWVTKGKTEALLQVLDIEDPESAIVFCNTKQATEQVAVALQREGFEAAWLNGDLPQNEREKVMGATREGRLRFLVATDVAARGIDISHLTHVINYDFPQDAESYVHRTGRTGRAGRTGTALSLVTPREVGGLYILRLTYKIRPVERQLPSAMEEKTRLETDLVDSLADTFAARGDGKHLDLARRLLTHHQAERIVAGLLRDHLTAAPEMEEVSQSRRRGKTPEPMEATKKERPKKERARKERPKSDEGRAGEARSEERGRSRDDEAPAEPKRTRRDEDDSEVVRSEAAGSKAAGSKAAGSKAAGSEAAGSEAAGKRPRSSGPKKARERKPRAAEGDAKAKSEDERHQPGEVKIPDDLGEGDGVAEPPQRRRRKRSKRAETSQAEDAARRSPAGRQADEDEEDPESENGEAHADRLELHVNVGRKDGAQVRTIKTILVDGGISAERVHRVRLRERYCFVEVDREVSEAAIEVLSGAKLDERQLEAEISRRSRG